MCDKGTEDSFAGIVPLIPIPLLPRMDKKIRDLEATLIELKAARNILESHPETIEAVQTVSRNL